MTKNFNLKSLRGNRINPNILSVIPKREIQQEQETLGSGYNELDNKEIKNINNLNSANSGLINKLKNIDINKPNPNPKLNKFINFTI